MFWRGFFKDPKQLEEPVRVMEQTRIYPLGKKDSAKPMQFPNASAQPANLLYATDGNGLRQFSLGSSTTNMPIQPDKEMRGMLATLGIIKGQKFEPDAHLRDLLDRAARTATRIGHGTSYDPSPTLTNGYWYKDRQWINVFPGNATFTGDTFDYIDPRTGFFTYAYSTSPGMARHHGECRSEVSHHL